MRNISSRAAPLLQHTPEAFHGIEVMSAPGWQARQPQWLVPVGQRRRQHVRPVHAPTVDHHDDLLLSATKAGHAWMALVAQPFGIAMGDDRREDVRGTIVDGAHDAEQHPPGTRLHLRSRPPRLAFEGLRACAVAAGSWGQAQALS
jgi:hypothetical protein